MLKLLTVFMLTGVTFALASARLNTARALDTLFTQCCNDRHLFDDAASAQEWCNYTAIVGESKAYGREGWPSEALRESPRFADYLQCMGMGMGKDWSRGCKKSLSGDCYKLCKLDGKVKAKNWLKLMDKCGPEYVLEALYAQIPRGKPQLLPSADRHNKVPSMVLAADMDVETTDAPEEPSTTTTTEEEPTTTPFPTEPDKDEAFHQCCVNEGIDESSPLECSYTKLAANVHGTLHKLMNPMNGSEEETAGDYVGCLGDGTNATDCCAEEMANPGCYVLCDLSDDSGVNPEKWAKRVDGKCSGEDIKAMLKCVQKQAYPVVPVSGAYAPKALVLPIMAFILGALAMDF